MQRRAWYRQPTPLFWAGARDGQQIREKARKAEDTNFGIAWYKPEQWLRLREIAADVEILEATHEEWRVLAEKAMDDFASLLVFPEKVEVDVEELLAWCQKQKRPVTGEARSGYVAWLMQEREKKTGKGKAEA